MKSLGKDHCKKQLHEYIEIHQILNIPLVSFKIELTDLVPVYNELKNLLPELIKKPKQQI